MSTYTSSASSGGSGQMLSARSLLLMVLLHLLFLASVFDIYFQSPVLTDVVVSHAPNYDAPARR